MSEIMQVSAKTLGKASMPNFCERCFWTLMHLEGSPPYSIFPSIFQRIDRYTKLVVHGHFDQYGKPPIWLKDLGVTGYIDPPSSRKFRTPIGDSVLLTGEADAIFTKADGTLLIADYKTAYAKGEQDYLYPIYKTQLNAYAFIADTLKLGKVSELALIYTEPLVADEAACAKQNMRDIGFCMGFEAKIFRVPLDLAGVAKALERAKKVYDKRISPPSGEECNDCVQLDRLRDLSLGADVDLGTM